MAKGTLRCLANPIRLKQLYGSGFKLYFNCQPENCDVAAQFIESILPLGWKKLDSFATNCSYEFPSEDGAISRLFRTIEEKKSVYGILDWGLGETTLEEVFIRLITETDAEANY